MKKLLLALVTLTSFSALAVNCSGNGYTVSVSGGQIHVAGNGLNVTAPVAGNYPNYRANINAQGVRSVSLTALSNGTLRIVKNRGVDTKSVSCN